MSWFFLARTGFFVIDAVKYVAGYAHVHAFGLKSAKKAENHSNAQIHIDSGHPT